MDEKISILLKLSEKNIVADNNETSDYSIDFELPIITAQQLHDFEIKLCDKSYRARVVSLSKIINLLYYWLPTSSFHFFILHH